MKRTAYNSFSNDSGKALLPVGVLNHLAQDVPVLWGAHDAPLPMLESNQAKSIERLHRLPDHRLTDAIGRDQLRFGRDQRARLQSTRHYFAAKARTQLFVELAQSQM